MENAEPDSSLLLPIGGGSYIKAKLRNSNKIIYGIGANTAIEKTMKEAKEGITTRVDRLNKTRLSIEQQFSKVLEKLREDQSRIQQMSADLNKEMGKKNVRKTPGGA